MMLTYIVQYRIPEGHDVEKKLTWSPVFIILHPGRYEKGIFE